MQFVELNTLDILEGLIQESELTPIFLFKHSNRCFVSSKMKTSLEGQVSSNKGTVYVLDVIKSRDISNHIASYFGVEHQSPQFLVVKNKEVILCQNHWEIDATELVFP